MIAIERTTLSHGFLTSLLDEAAAAGLVTQFDSTAAASIPLDPSKPRPNVAVASYCDGNLPRPFFDCLARYPWLAKIERVVSIGSRANTIARISDMEPGNPLNAAQTAAWVVMMARHFDTHHNKIYRPGGYTDLSEMAGLQQALARTGLPRSKYSIWLARPGISVAEAVQLLRTFDCVQIAFDHAYDVSLAKPDFYPPTATAPSKPHELAARAEVAFTHESGQTGTVRALVTHKLQTHEYHVHGVPSTHKGKWTIRHLGK